MKLSYTTMNELIHEPHTWLCKTKLKLKRITRPEMEMGTAAHNVIQAHISGQVIHPVLSLLPETDLPKFPEVERTRFDEGMRVSYPINDDFEFVGYTDARNTTRGVFLEIKTGKEWTAGEFARLEQWKLYAIGLPTFEEVFFLNTPSKIDEWNARNIRPFAMKIAEEHRQQGWQYIWKAIDIIEHINEQNLYPEKRSWWCNYKDCPFCPTR